MTSEILQTASAALIVLGTLLTATGGFGQHYFGKRMEREKEVAQQVAAAQLEKTKEAEAIVRSEAARRAQVLVRLRTLYLASHDGISPEFMAGIAPMPKSWVETKLKELGEDWRQEFYR